MFIRRSIALVARALALGSLAVAPAIATEAHAGDAAIQRLDLAGRSDGRPFAHTVVAGDTIYLAGTLGLDPETRRPPAAVEEEVRLVMDGIRAKLELAGATMDDLVSVQVFCPDLELYDQFNEVYATYFEKGYPVRSFIGSGPLLFGARFEVNAVAVKPR